ncbi:MAG: hypothetical protein HY675_15925 [Chloroflexi bacterium]|nr:hypothetical protein [Chloroflexota bacterium]
MQTSHRLGGLRAVIVLLAILVSPAFVAVGCGADDRVPAGDAGSSASASGGSSKSAAQETMRALTKIDLGKGKVSVQFSWVTLEYLKAKGEAGNAERYALDKNVVFLAGMDTHSGSLSDIDLTKSVALRDEQGKEYTPTGWQSLSEDSHHRSGLLTFDKKSAEGKPLISPSAKFFEVVVRNVGGIDERVLKWDLGDLVAKGHISIGEE